MQTTEYSGRKLKIFLCHAKEDAMSVRDVYERLSASGFIPWMDEYELLPGIQWRSEIAARIADTDVAIMFLSTSSVIKDGFVQEEFELILKKAEKLKVGGTIFLIPARLDKVELPPPLQQRLAQWQIVSLDETGGYRKLLKALEAREGDFSIERQRPIELVKPAPQQDNKERKLLPSAKEPEEGDEDVVVFVPGFFGSELRYRGPGQQRTETVWSTDGTILLYNLKYHRDWFDCKTPLKAGIVLPNIYFGPQSFPLYQQLLDTIKQLGYDEGRNFFPFAYDWRLSISTNAEKLANFILEKANFRRVTLIAHSMGGLIVRYMLADQRTRSLEKNLQTVIQIATPVLGSSRAYYALKESAELGDLCEWMKDEMAKYDEDDEDSFESLKAVMNGFESVMELLPHKDNKILKTKGGTFRSALDPGAWPGVDEGRLKNIHDVQEVIRAEGSLPLIAIYSVDIGTDHIYEVNNEFRITKKMRSEGDGVAIEVSAEHGTVKHPMKIKATHYRLLSRPQVLNIVKTTVVHKLNRDAGY